MIEGTESSPQKESCVTDCFIFAARPQIVHQSSNIPNEVAGDAFVFLPNYTSVLIRGSLDSAGYCGHMQADRVHLLCKWGRSRTCQTYINKAPIFQKFLCVSFFFSLVIIALCCFL